MSSAFLAYHPLRAATLLGLLGALSACQAVADIKDREFARGDGGLDYATPSEQQCTDYCAQIGTGCPSDSIVSAFANPSYCLEICKRYPLAGDEDAKGHNFECRMKEARTAARIAPDYKEATENCRSAGVGGATECGDLCESYCQLYGAICPTPEIDCQTKCQALISNPAANASDAFTDGVDTLQCRLAHLSAAAIDADPHCDHAAILPTQPGPCYPAVPSCSEYCSMVMNVCGDENVRQYDDQRECEAVCSAGMTPSSEPVDNAANLANDTVACRRYHAYNVLVTSRRDVHCAHAGPSGDGHCGVGCPAYCKLAQAACGDGFAAAFPGGESECLAACADFPTSAGTPDLDFKYTVSKGAAGGNTMDCRIYHTVKAFADGAQCESALGGGRCQ